MYHISSNVIIHMIPVLHSLEGYSDFEKFFHEILPSCPPIARCHLERYGEETAVNVTVAILRAMKRNNAVEKLQNAYTGTVVCFCSSFYSF